MTDTKGPQWCPLSHIPYKLDHLNSELPLGEMRPAISNAVLSGEAAVRGKRSTGDYYRSPGAAFERLDKHLSWRADLNFELSRIIIPSADPFPASLRELSSFGKSFSGSFVEVEADLLAVEAWIRENCLPHGADEEPGGEPIGLLGEPNGSVSEPTRDLPGKSPEDILRGLIELKVRPGHHKEWPWKRVQTEMVKAADNILVKGLSIRNIPRIYKKLATASRRKK